ncbi:MAG: hypothetical protein ACYTEQ_29815 [Planctomycetota bacterium]|jgi:hypothetical protein
MTFGGRRDGANDKDYYTKVGNRGESAALRLLGQVFGHYAIKDVRNDPQWQRKDVDFIVTMENGQKRTEVKSDRHLGGANFCFELGRIRHNTSWETAFYKGWSIRTAAHVLLMWHDDARTMYVVCYRAFVEGLQRYLEASNGVRMGAVPTDNARTTFNIYVPQQYVAHTRYIEKENGYWEYLGEWKAPQL